MCASSPADFSETSVAMTAPPQVTSSSAPALMTMTSASQTALFSRLPGFNIPFLPDLVSLRKLRV